MSPIAAYFTSSAAVLTFGWNTELYPEGLNDYERLLDPALAGGQHRRHRTVGRLRSSTSGCTSRRITARTSRDRSSPPRSRGSTRARCRWRRPSRPARSRPATSCRCSPTRRQRARLSTPDWPTQVWGARFNTAILKIAPHPNAAQVLANFMITEPRPGGDRPKGRIGAARRPRRRDDCRRGPRSRT